MTCICGMISDGDVWIGGDSAGVAGLSITIRADEKVFKIGEQFIAGFTTSFRMGQLLRYKLDPPAQTISESDMKYLTTAFVESCQKCFADNGFGSKHEGGIFLLGYKSKLYTIDSDYQVGEPAGGYDAVGCGSQLALGSMFSSVGKKPADRIKLALSAASHFSGGVAPPFTILKLSDAPAKKPSKKRAKK